METLENWKNRIKVEAKYGDKQRACKEAGVSQTTWLNAMKRIRVEDLKEKELKVIIRFIEILDERKKQLDKIKRKYADN